MKTLITIIVLIAGIEGHTASVFRCRSYNTGNFVVADLNTRSLIFKDRFGNELDVLDEVMARITTINSTPVSTEIILTRSDNVVFRILDQGDTVNGETIDDNSFQCFKIKSVL